MRSPHLGVQLHVSLVSKAKTCGLSPKACQCARPWTGSVRVPRRKHLRTSISLKPKEDLQRHSRLQETVSKVSWMSDLK